MAGGQGPIMQWLLESGEPAAVWVTLTRLQGRPESDPQVMAARRTVLGDAGTRELVSRLPDWEVDNNLSGHHSPGFAPNLLLLLNQMGVGTRDEPRVERLLDQMLAHQDEDGHFQSFGRSGHGAAGREAEPRWSSLLCDHHAILESLLRFGRAGDPRTQRGLTAMLADAAPTAQGLAWPCRPEPVSGFRGPGRKADFCPQVTLEALRVGTLVARRAGRSAASGASNTSAGEPGRPDTAARPEMVTAARVLVRAWRRRSDEKPYLFGHGIHFKTVKWPTFWYDISAVLDAIADYPEVWRPGEGETADRRAVAEMAACLIAYNLDSDGRVTPRSCYKGFESFSFGQKKRPSAFATARLASILRRLEAIADDISSVDVTSLASSKGGSGRALPPAH